jgi:hypothetical protein
MAVKQVFNTSAELDFPNVLPTLDLDFANSKTLDPRITFTRSSGGSYVGADGLIKYAGVNEARFDHDPETGESLGLLVEEARTNLLLRSEEFGNSYWSKTRSSVSTVTDIISPDGLQNTHLFRETVSEPNSHTITRNNTYQSGFKYSFSVFAKAYGSGNRKLFMLFGAGAFPSQQNATFDLVTGTVSGINITNGSEAKIEKYPNGWYRCTLIGATTTSTTTSTSILYLQSENTVVYPGDGVSGVYIWGAQIEQGSFPTSYIPTQGSTRTRAADNASITGKNFSEWYRQDEGTVLVGTRVQSHVQSNFPRLFSIDDGTLFNFLSVVRGSNTRRIDYSVWNSGIGQAIGLNNGILPQVNSNIKAAIIYKRNEFTGANVGVQINSDTSGNVPIVTSLNIGMRGQSGLHYNGTISRLTYFPKRLPNSQLISLTT